VNAEVAIPRNPCPAFSIHHLQSLREILQFSGPVFSATVKSEKSSLPALKSILDRLDDSSPAELNALEVAVQIFLHRQR